MEDAWRAVTQKLTSAAHSANKILEDVGNKVDQLTANVSLFSRRRRSEPARLEEDPEVMFVRQTADRQSQMPFASGGLPSSARRHRISAEPPGRLTRHLSMGAESSRIGMVQRRDSFGTPGILDALPYVQANGGAPIAVTPRTPSLVGYSWRKSMPKGGRLSTGSAIEPERKSVRESTLAKVERKRSTRKYNEKTEARYRRAGARRRNSVPFTVRTVNGHSFQRLEGSIQKPQRTPLLTPTARTELIRRRESLVATTTPTRITPKRPPAAKRPRGTIVPPRPPSQIPPPTRNTVATTPPIEYVKMDFEPVSAVKAVDVAKLMKVPREQLVEVFQEGVVRMMEADVRFAEKMLRKHGAEVMQVLRRYDRAKHREAHKKDSEEALIRLRAAIKAKYEREKHAAAERDAKLNGIASSAEQPPPVDDPRWKMDYWTAIGPYEEDLSAAIEAEGGKSVTDENSAFAPLTDNATRRVRNILGAEHGDPVYRKCLVNIGGCRVTGADLQLLRPNTWLNDEVVNAYLELLFRRSIRMQEGAGSTNGVGASFGSETPLKIRCMSSFFYSKLYAMDRNVGMETYDYTRVRRWTRKFDVFALDRLIVPVNQHNMHWTLAVINFADKTVEHYDSFGGSGAITICENLLRWVADESDHKKNIPLDVNAWSTVHMTRKCPQQDNSDDCGVFVCKFSDFISKGTPIPWKFGPNHMNYFRARMAHEILFQRVA